MFLEVTGNPTYASFHAHGEDFQVQGRLYMFFVTPDNSTVPFDLLMHLRRRPTPPDEEMISVRADNTATHEANNFDQVISLVTPLIANSAQVLTSLPDHHVDTSTISMTSSLPP